MGFFFFLTLWCQQPAGLLSPAAPFLCLAIVWDMHSACHPLHACYLTGDKLAPGGGRESCALNRIFDFLSPL
jgi:hypothetical protein